VHAAATTLHARVKCERAIFRIYWAVLRPAIVTDIYVENKAGLTGQTVPGRRIPGHWPYPGPEELAETEPVGPDAWTFLSFNYHPASALAA